MIGTPPPSDALAVAASEYDARVAALIAQDEDLLDYVTRLETLIDELNETVGPLSNFLLPGGSPGAAQLHVARTICRRAERATITLSREEAIGDLVLPYLNRLSDALFVMARYENHTRGVDEPLWQPGL